MNIIDWESANEYLSHGKYKSSDGLVYSRPVPSKKATWVDRLSNGDITLKYHTTNVITYHKDGTFTLNTNGWTTSTTKERINYYSRAHIYQNKYRWYVYTHGGVDYHFVDGMTFDKNGVLI